MAKRKRKKLPRPPAWILPKSLEREYERFVVNETANRLRDLIESVVIPRLRSIHAEAVSLQPDAQAARLDEWPEEVDALAARLQQGLDLDNDAVRRKAGDISIRLSEQNRGQFSKVLRKTIGTDVFRSEPWLNAELSSFTRQNTRLIKTLKERSIGEVEGIVQRGIRGAARVEDIEKQLRGLTNKTRANAKLIARDQIAKANSDLAQKRQEEIGITRYIWRTSKDERVRGRAGGLYPKARPSHWVMEGKVCRWDDPTVYQDGDGKWKKRSSLSPAGVNLHPGKDYQCRCTAEPILEDILGDEIQPPEAIAPAPTPPPPRRARPKTVKTATRKPQVIADMSPAEQDAYIDGLADEFEQFARAERTEVMNLTQEQAIQMNELSSVRAKVWEASRDHGWNSPEYKTAMGRFNASKAEIKALDKKIVQAQSAVDKKMIATYRQADPVKVDMRVDASRKRGNKKPTEWSRELGQIVDKRATKPLEDLETGQPYFSENFGFTLSGSRYGQGGRACVGARGTPNGNTIFLPATKKRGNLRTTYFHESGHILENQNPKILQAANDFHARRTAGDKVERLADLFPGWGYRWDEKTKKDKFDQPYTGKLYPNHSTEVVSMGIEHLATDPVLFKKRDPDFYRWTVKVLSGVFE